MIIFSLSGIVLQVYYSHHVGKSCKTLQGRQRLCSDSKGSRSGMRLLHHIKLEPHIYCKILYNSKYVECPDPRIQLSVGMCRVEMFISISIWFLSGRTFFSFQCVYVCTCACTHTSFLSHERWFLFGVHFVRNLATGKYAVN